MLCKATDVKQQSYCPTQRYIFAGSSVSTALPAGLPIEGAACNHGR